MAPPADPQPASERREPAALSDRDLDVLTFEREWPRHGGAKEEAIRSRFGLSTARYYQVLNALIDSPAAVVHDPMLVRRLQRMRDDRTAVRAARTGRTMRGPRHD